MISPSVTVALDLLGFVISLVLLISCLIDHAREQAGGKSFLLLLGALSLSLAVDAAAWLCDGHASVALLAILAHTAAHVLGYLTLLLLADYLCRTLFYRNSALRALNTLLGALGALAILACVANAYHGFSFTVTDGYFTHGPLGFALHLFPILLLICLALALLLANGFSPAKRAFYLTWTLFPLAGALLDVFLPLSLSLVGTLVSVLLIYTGVYLQRRRTIMEQRNALMISQINPHFMYNTLTTVASLCDTSPAEAKALTIEFSSYLRRNLGALTSSTLIPFEDELRHVGCYLKIERARFGERLRVIYDIRAKDFSLPVLSIQPLVENAVKHGITKKREGGTVRITAYDTARHHVVEILDDGVGFDTEERPDNTHVGIVNVRERLHNMCHGTLTVRSTKGVGTRITVEIPKRKDKS